MNSKVTFKQITLITDGCSNCGTSPIEAARKAKKMGISVNVIGIVDKTNKIHNGIYEIEKIADEGGGLSQIVELNNISKTIQMVTRQTITNTIQQVVNKELYKLFASESNDKIKMTDRVKAVEVIENMAENSNLKVLLLIDLSSSMISKMKKVEEAILDFFLSLHSRAGESEISVLTFPNERNVVDIKISWTKDIQTINKVVNRLKPNGNTPTGPAILSSISYFDNDTNYFSYKGILDEYVI